MLVPMHLLRAKANGAAIAVAVVLASAALTAAPPPDAAPRVHDFVAKDTLTVAELHHGDELRFRLKSGAVRSFVLEGASARIVEKVSGGIVYAYECRFRADGQPLTLRRYACTQESFYEPWVVNGVRLWVSSSAAVFKLVPLRYPESHYKFTPDAVVALQDATLPICPQLLTPWYPFERPFINVGTCYNGDDPWLGPYLGEACHIGLDINMRKGTVLTAPIDFDDQFIFDSDHRWRGVRKWPNGDVWALQSHHLGRLLVEQKTALKAGTRYAEGAVKGIGSHPHSHFEFRVGPGAAGRGLIAGIEIDPWILFWQMFETDRDSKGLTRAAMAPLAPAKTGEAVRFAATGSRAGRDAGPLRHVWAFGDGGCARGAAAEHTFTRPGVHPVTLVVDDGRTCAMHTQHLSVTGDRLAHPAPALDATDEVSFRPRPVGAVDVYGWPVPFIPHTLRFAAAPDGAAGTADVAVRNIGQGELPPCAAPAVTYRGDGKDWLRLERAGNGNAQKLTATANPKGLAVGRHDATVEVACPGAVNARQVFSVELTVRPSPTAREVVVDDKDAGFYATPYAWVGHQLLRCPRKGYAQRYLTNGARAEADAVTRFTPDLAAGRYEVAFHPDTPFTDARFFVRIRHAQGGKLLQFTAGDKAARTLGEFEFLEGTDGFVEIAADRSEGLVVADAVVFRRVRP